MVSSQSEIVIPASPRKLLLILAGSLAFVAGGFWMLSVNDEDTLKRTAVGIASIGFFGACGLYAVFRLVKPSPAVVINDRGIVDNASALSTGLTRWDEIEEIREYSYQNQVFLGIYPKDLEAWLAKRPAWKRSAIRANLLLGVAPANIPQVVLPMRVSELLKDIDARFQRSTRFQRQ